MSIKLCWLLGLIAGAFTGVLMSLTHASTACCGAPVFPPTFGRLALDGIVVALIAVFIAAALMVLLTHLPAKPVFLLALFVGIVTGLLVGPLAYHIHNPGVAMIVGAILGAILGWLICRLLCGGKLSSTFIPGVAR
ncbi:MAG: hypothetical protein ABSE51_04415 [Terracidiphilus sp.]|jgi:hypothetical protein